MKKTFMEVFILKIISSSLVNKLHNSGDEFLMQKTTPTSPRLVRTTNVDTRELERKAK